ncbi:MAG TPA: efflux RND transporter permease subunit, partial [Bacteroidota bacterium]|nr:efflux RND transporter permease subunit [Bacteroidota bacterium]
KLFRPLAFTKTFVLAGSAIIAVTLVPVLMTLLTRGKFRTEGRNPVTRVLGNAYRPVITLALRYRKTAIALNVLMLLAAVPMVMLTGSEFMPPLDEGSLLFMPVALPSASITEINRILRVQDAAIRSVPEVESVLGKAGRAETSTDPAPVSMIETIIILKPKAQWRPGLTKNEIIAELDRKLQIPGVRNGWTQPIINRINMLSTGIRTDLGVKIFGRNLDTLEALAVRAEGILRTIPGAADVYAERSQGGEFLDITIDREAVGRYGVSVGDVEDVIETALGGENIGTVIDGRERFPLRVRYARDWHTSLDAVRSLPVPVARIMNEAGSLRVSPVSAAAGMGGGPMGAPPLQAGVPLPTVPLSALARIAVRSGPPMIASENGQLRSVVLLNVRGRDMGSFVGDAREALTAGLRMPAGYTVLWSGQWENQVRAKARLELLMPLVFLIIYVMLYFVTKNYVEAAVVMLSVPFALVGGVYFIFILGYNFSVAVWVGFIALYGLAVETGVVMVIYLHESLDRRLKAHERGERGPVTAEDITEATIEGSVLRLRPKIMTVGTAMIALVPIMWSTGTGADVMRPLVAPMIGGLVTSTIHVLVVTPVLFLMMKRRALRQGRLKASHMSSGVM